MEPRFIQKHFSWIALGLLALSTACGSSMTTSEPARARGLIDLNARMPVGESPYGIAYGAPTQARGLSEAPNIDAYLKPEYASKQRAGDLVATRSPRVAKRTIMTPRAVAPAPVALAPEAPVANAPSAEPVLIASAQPTSSSDATGYAAREQKQAKGVEKFVGGDAIVITGGALLLILLIVILILLLR